MKTMSTLHVNSVLLKELWMALSSRKKTVVSAGSSITAPGGGLKSSKRPSRRLQGKRKANELASSGESIEPAIRRPVPNSGSAHLPATSATDE